MRWMEKILPLPSWSSGSEIHWNSILRKTVPPRFVYCHIQEVIQSLKNNHLEFLMALCLLAILLFIGVSFAITKPGIVDILEQILTSNLVCQ